MSGYVGTLPKDDLNTEVPCALGTSSEMTFICENQGMPLESGSAATQPRGDPNTEVPGTSSEMTYRCESEWMPLESGDAGTLQEDVLARPCDEHWLVHL